jgi:RecA-family ATPase
MSLEHTLELLRAEEREHLAKLAACRADMAELSGDVCGVKAMRLDEWAKQDLGSFQWIVNGLIAMNSVTIFAAEPGAGKSTLLAQMAACIGSGTEFLGFGVSRVLPVLTVASEGSELAFRNRYLVGCESLRIDIDGLPNYVKPPGFTDYKIGSPGLDSLIESSGAKLVILDTIGYFHDGDENDANDWKRHVMRPLRAITAKYGCAFILVHHHNKGDRQGWQKGRGTTAMFADCDHWLRLEKAEGAGETARDLFIDKNKYGRMDMRIPLNFRLQGAVFETR